MSESVQLKKMNSTPVSNLSVSKPKDTSDCSNAKFQTEKDCVTIKKPKQKEITFKEGFLRVLSGAAEQLSDTIKSIIKNPGKTALIIGGTTAGLLTLPFFGIPVAAGSALLAVGYGGIALGKGICNISDYVKNCKNKDYNKARKDLEKIGRDTFDIAISLPFIPKGVGSIKRFCKYGKIGINNEAISAVKEADGLINKVKAVFSAGKNLERHINLSQATDIEFAKLTNITAAEKVKIRNYVEKYNVPREKIPDVVLELWAQERGIKAKPKWYYAATAKNTAGGAVNRDSCIIIKDRSKADLIKEAGIGGQVDPIWEQIGKLDNGTTYKITYKNTKTGKIQTEILDKKINEARNNIGRTYHNLSEECQEINSLTHEREHIDQFARIYSIGEKWKNSSVTPEAAKIYKEMAKDMKPMTPKEIAKYKAMAQYQNTGTMTNYIMEPCEIGAREAETKLLARKDFQVLDKVFKRNSKIHVSDTGAEIVLNSLRTQSKLNTEKT